MASQHVEQTIIMHANPSSAKKAYHSPQLKDFGHISELTKAASDNFINPSDSGTTPPNIYATS